MTVPIPSEMAETLKQFRAKLEAFDDGWLFPAKSGDKPWRDNLFSQGLRRAERVAKLPKLRGSLWHALRRKWAIEHKDEPMSDVMAVGGWKDPKTLLTCYQLADDATMLRVMSVPKKLRAANSGK
jgi:integrase